MSARETGQTPEQRAAELKARARRMEAVHKGIRYGRSKVAEERERRGER
ncbi:hypothetical protein ACI2LJ_36005 [Streptomyces sp. NPDC088090]